MSSAMPALQYFLEPSAVVIEVANVAVPEEHCVAGIQLLRHEHRPGSARLHVVGATLSICGDVYVGNETGGRNAVSDDGRVTYG